MVITPEMAPATEGLNVMTILQVLAGMIVLPMQLSDSVKSPLAATVCTVSGAVPVLVKVTFFVPLETPRSVPGKVRVVAERLTAGAIPVPLRFTTCGLLPASSLIVKAPLRLPVAVGLKVTVSVQLPPAGTVEPQVFACKKSPLALTLKMLSVVA